MEARAEAVGKPFGGSEAKLVSMIGELSDGARRGMSNSELEEFIGAGGLELQRLLLEDYLEVRASFEDATTVVVAADGTQLTHQRWRQRTLMSIFGLVTFARLAFSTRMRSSLMPMDAELNVPAEHYSLGVRRRVAEEAVRGSFDDALAALQRSGIDVPKRQAEELVRSAAVDFDLFYAAGGGELGAEPASEGDLLVLSSDGKGIVMLPQALRETTRKAAASASRKLQKRLSKGEKRNRKRMATVAAVYSIAPHVRRPDDIVRNLAAVRDVDAPKPPRPVRKRVWASVEKDAAQVIAEVFDEGERRDPGHRMQWVCVVDGNEDQLRHFRAQARDRGVALTMVLDVIHVIEYLWRATTAVHGEGNPETERIVTERLRKILEGRAIEVAAGIRQSATKRALRGDRAKAVLKAADYIYDHAEMMRYQDYLAAGYPIASGVIEGACRHLVKDRMDLTGARWGLDTAEAILRLRALRTSGDFAAYWSLHEQMERDRVHGSRYADDDPPSSRRPTPSGGRSHLRLVPSGAA